ncbi:hypothetical protein RHSIM_Rhsim12G0133600 [Rhododendron simsii]|uniref:DUF155 domain-containing protein n=1 Tax=Rhododendron simsii TaxID=118357 RepID=A0A834G9N0_RHOSS|nr:hypothetical protein RHSIM_Rhsim12G0133600 [Rhododendron simsii]
MGRWRAFLTLSNIARFHKPSSNPYNNSSPRHLNPLSLWFAPNSARTQFFSSSRGFSAAAPSPSPFYTDEEELDYRGAHDFCDNHHEEDAEAGKIPIKSYFLCTSINLKSMHAENSRNVILPTSRSSNYIALRFCNFPSDATGIRVEENGSCCRYMVVFQYGSAVLFNVEDPEVESYLDIVRRHASGLLSEMRKDGFKLICANFCVAFLFPPDYTVKEKPLLGEDMQGGPDYIVLKNLDTDSIRIIGSVLGQSIALDYFVSQVLHVGKLRQIGHGAKVGLAFTHPKVDGIVEEFTDINRGMEKTGTFTMERKKLFQLVGKANSSLADVILKVGLFDRSEIAWRDAKYAQIFEYLRDEYEVTQRFGNLDFKLKFVEHNIHFLQEALQNRKSDLLEWCIILLLSIENVISVYEIIRESPVVST